MAEYTGRFAPAPTGPLHFGSIVTALASFLEARARGGRWLLRIEDLDTPRAIPGASDDLLRTLEQLGLWWDGAVQFQHERIELYREALDRLTELGLTYPCACTREMVGAGRPYEGTCRGGLPSGTRSRSVRIRVGNVTISHDDPIQGRIVQQLDMAIGDFVVRRADAQYAYHLAVVVDDVAQGITDVVRGADLLDSTPRQLHLHRVLGAVPPSYAHVPMVVDQHGLKLSKQNRAPRVPILQPAGVLQDALEVLGQKPPPTLGKERTESALHWAVTHWRLSAVPGCPALRAPEYYCYSNPVRR